MPQAFVNRNDLLQLDMTTILYTEYYWCYGLPIHYYKLYKMSNLLICYICLFFIHTACQVWITPWWLRSTEGAQRSRCVRTYLIHRIQMLNNLQCYNLYLMSYMYSLHCSTCFEHGLGLFHNVRCSSHLVIRDLEKASRKSRTKWLCIIWEHGRQIILMYRTSLWVTWVTYFGLETGDLEDGRPLEGSKVCHC